MSSKSTNQRTFLDPIHGPIRVNLLDKTERLIAEIIDSKEFQRLKRIHQMGLGWFTFHGAEHTRFGHSLGAMQIAKRMITHLSKSYPGIKKFKEEILIAALIHDIGHGPFSHTSEKPTGFNHEDWTKKIILGESEINSILKKHDAKLPRKIIEIFNYKPYKWIGQIVSSYVDCDRLDYLHRDSYYVGVPYGLTGSDRIIDSLDIDIKSKLLVIKESVGLDTVVHYLHARDSMYQQIYQHKKNLACDFLLRKIIERAKEVKPSNISKPLSDWLNYENKPMDKIELSSFIQVDDFTVISAIQEWANNSDDEILRDLSYSFIYRKLFKSLEFRSDVKTSEINKVVIKAALLCKKKKLNPIYYAGIEKSANKPYEPYSPSSHKTGKAIFIKQKDGKIIELSKHEAYYNTPLKHRSGLKTCLVFSPKIENEIYKIKEFHRLFK